MADIMHLVKIAAPPERVYEALTTPEGIRGWWTRDADLDAAVGGAGTFRFHGGSDVTTITVKELEPPLHVHWKTRSSFRPEWDGTTITFDLRAEQEYTVLSFAHRGFETADERYAVTTTGWGVYLASLRQYLETGTGS
ncbi:MAG TPA: SRPBCC domain-containing protein, partial [Alphaproteobacteria bacterium]|nr:SRPBCC domain-containing protein [Alphaproteobacteria bacterium]